MNKKSRVLIVDDEQSVRKLLYEIVKRLDCEIQLAENGQEALEKYRAFQPQVVLMDIKMPILDGLSAFRQMQQEETQASVILMTAFGTVDTAVEAMRQGAFDYLVKPSNLTEVRSVLMRALAVHQVAAEQPLLGPAEPCLTGVIGNSSIMQQVYKIVGRVAPTNATVLISGESGSGKELIAKTIHYNSKRRLGPFIKVNCGALPDGLMESEMFGYEKGAFTGAVARKLGRFELAHQGTLFLDEVGELPQALQVKLLRVLQEREFERVGGTETIQVDIRLIAATNCDLTSMVKKGSFREDLFYRLNVVPIEVPALRYRSEDIPLLVDAFVRRFTEESGKSLPYVTPGAMAALLAYSWPGNVRELANLMERAVIMTNGVIDVEDFPLPLAEQEQERITSYSKSALGKGTLKEVMQQVEKEVIARALVEHGGNRVRTAQALQISRRTLLYKIEEYQL
ncbi:MAG: sigma-54 dependent transcriptional regulator [Sporomusaceae bacterium]|nr:sigma-54 dependent transcriptional regulator [Sporomusaceae bacterium]